MKNSLLVSLALACPFSLSAAGQQATIGQWQNGPNLPFFPVHMHTTQTGKLIIWPGDNGVSGNDPRLFDPVSGSVTPLAAPGYDVFCSGHSLLPDGRLFVAGGHISNNVGLPSSTIYDPTNNVWIRQRNMNLGRWYPTDQVLPNGDVLVVSGDVDVSTGNNPLPQVWQASTGTWRSLVNAQLQLSYTRLSRLLRMAKFSCPGSLSLPVIWTQPAPARGPRSRPYLPGCPGLRQHGDVSTG